MSFKADGDCEDRFAPVREAFERNFTDLGEVGAALCIYFEGRPVVDLWGGHKDAAGTLPWQRDTLVCVYSVTKGLTALCVHMLVDRGSLPARRCPSGRRARCPPCRRRPLPTAGGAARR